MEQEYKVKIAKRLKKKKRMVHKYETIKNKEEHFLHLKKKRNTSCNYVVATKVDCLAL